LHHYDHALFCPPPTHPPPGTPYEQDYNKRQQQQLNVLVQRIQKPLSRLERQKIMTIVTIEVHARDVVANLIRDKVRILRGGTLP